MLIYGIGLGGGAVAYFIVITPWLALYHKEPRKPLNLFVPDLVASVHIDITATGERKMYCSKFPPETTQQTIGHVAIAVMESGMDFAKQYGVEIKMEQK